MKINFDDPRLDDLEKEILEKTEEDGLILDGQKAAKELSELWAKIPDDENEYKKFAEFENISGFADPGKQLWERELEIAEKEAQEGHFSHEEKIKRIQGAIDIVSHFKDRVKKLLDSLERRDSERFGSEGENIEGLMNGKIEKSRTRKIEELRKEIEDERKEYLELDYKKNNAYKRIQKFLGNISFGKKKDEDGAAKNENYEQDVELAEYRAHYDNKLLQLQELLIADAKERGASNEELANIYAEFRVEQRVTMESEHDNVKSEQMEKSKLGLIGKAIVNVGDSYRKLSFGKKMAIAGAMFGGGLAVAGSAGFAASAFGTVALTKRLLGGLATGIGTNKGLEAKGQRKEGKKIEKEKAGVLETFQNLEGLSEDLKKEFLVMNVNGYKKREDENDVDYENRIKEAISPDNFKYIVLSEKINRNLIRDEENAINKIKDQDIKQMLAGVSMGAFAAFAMPAIVKEYGGDTMHWIKDKLGFYDNVKDDGTLLHTHQSFTKDGLASSHNSTAEVPPAGSMAAGSGNDYANMVDSKSAAAAGKTASEQMLHSPNAESVKVVIKEPMVDSSGHMRHDSFIKNLKHYLQENRKDIDNPAHAAEVMFHDAAKEYANTHGITYDQAVAKLSRIHPGTSYEITKDLHMKLNDENIKFVKSIKRIIPEEIKTPTPPVEQTVEKPITPDNIPDAVLEQAAPDTVPYNPEHDYQKIQTEMKYENAIKEADALYSNAADDALRNPQGGDGPSIEQFEKLGNEDIIRKDAAETLREMQAEDIPWVGNEDISSLIEKGAGTKQILGVSLRNITNGHTDRLGYWAEIKNKPVLDVIYENTEGKKQIKPGFLSVMQKFKPIIGENAVINLKDNKETVGKWLARITRLALEKKAQS